MTLELDWPVDGLEPLSFLLARVLEPLCDGLVARGRRAAALALDLGLVDGTVHRARAPARRALGRAADLADAAAPRPRGASARATRSRRITVRAEPTPSRVVQFSLLDPAQPSPERLAETMARLHAWTAAGRGGAAALLDTHRPGAFALGTFAPGPLPRRRAPRRRAGPPRVALRVFRPPPRAEVVAARRGARLRRGRRRARRRRGPRGAVARLGGLVGRGLEPRGMGRGPRDGGVYRIFRDRLREAWFVEGELD